MVKPFDQYPGLSGLFPALQEEQSSIQHMKKFVPEFMVIMKPYQ